jgi:hypothetical protein
MFRYSLFLILISLVFFASISLAGIPKMINYQGMLTDNSGTPLTGSYNLTFKIWTDTTGGSSLWTETQNGVQVTNGLFNVILGKQTALNLAFDQQYWLELGVGAETMPRIRFTSVGYAYRAAIADSATVAVSAPTGGGWTKNGNRVSLANSSDSVGIGTSSPGYKLDVNDRMRVRKGNSQTAGIWFNHPVGDRAFVGLADDTTVGFWGNIGAEWGMAMNTRSGNVGVGTTRPNSSLQINGSLSVAYKYMTSDYYTLTDSDCVIGVDVSGHKREITLPSAVGRTGRVYTIKAIAGGMYVELFTTSSQTIDNYSTGIIELSLWQYITVVSNGSNWMITGKNF